MKTVKLSMQKHKSNIRNYVYKKIGKDFFKKNNTKSKTPFTFVYFMRDNNILNIKISLKKRIVYYELK
jgi:hypothetical protein